MKKFIAGVIALSLVCGMSACGSGESSSSDETTTTTATSEETTTTTTPKVPTNEVSKEGKRYFGKIVFDNDQCTLDTGSNLFVIDTSNFKNIEKFKDTFNEVKLDCRATGTDNNMLKISSFTYDKVEYTPETFDNITQQKTSTTTSKPKTTTTTTTTKATTTKATTTTTTAATTLKNPSSVSAWGWSGSGDFVATDLQVENYAIITASHDGSHNFTIHAYNEDGSRDLLVNTIGWYSGSTLIVGSGTYEIEIKGDGNWSVNAYALSTTEDTSFSGTGDFVTPIFYAKNNNWNITNDGEHNFSVKQYSINTDRYDLLVNEIGSYSGIVKSDVGNETFFEIKSEGNWSISPA